MSTDTTTQDAIDGWERPLCEYQGQGMWSSTNWMAYHAGQFLALSGHPAPVKAKASRGMSIRVTFADKSQVVVKFAGDSLDQLSIA